MEDPTEATGRRPEPFTTLLRAAEQLPTRAGKDLVHVAAVVAEHTALEIYGRPLPEQLRQFFQTLAAWYCRRAMYPALETLRHDAKEYKLLPLRSYISERLQEILYSLVSAALVLDSQWVRKNLLDDIRQRRREAINALSEIIIARAAELLYVHNPTKKLGQHQRDITDVLRKNLPK